MRARSFFFFSLGTLLVAVSLGTRLYIIGAESEAARVGQAQFRELASRHVDQPDRATKSSLLEHFARIPDSHLLLTTPPGAMVKGLEPLEGESPLTPTLLPNIDRAELTLSTRFRSLSGVTLEGARGGPLKLPYKFLYSGLLNLLWPGLLFLGLAWKSHRSFSASSTRPSGNAQSDRKHSSLDTVVKTSPPRPPTALVEHHHNTPEELIYGRFVQGSLLGEGNMGQVFTCRSCIPHDTETYALKLLKSEWSQSEDFRKRFEREIDICLKLSHPNLVKAHGRGDKGGRLWMVMDYLEGQELSDWLKENRAEEQQVLHLGISLCDGLEHAHDQGVVHRDLKPSNIIVKAEGQQPVIADFGLARGKHYDTITKTNTTLGTPVYMPPEQITGGLAGPQGDLYSLGCILYEALSGAPPFDEPDVMKLLSKKLMEPAPPLPENCASSKLSTLLSKLLETEPSKRPQSARELREQLYELLQDSNTD